LPPPLRSILGISYLIARKTPRRLVLITSSHSCELYSWSGSSKVMPALLNATSSLPNFSTGSIHEVFNIALIAYVDAYTLRLAAASFDSAPHFVCQHCSSSAETHLGAFRGKLQCRCSSTSRGRARDKNYLDQICAASARSSLSRVKPWSRGAGRQ